MIAVALMIISTLDKPQLKAAIAKVGTRRAGSSALARLIDGERRARVAR
jgi:hypothetical protein